MIKLFFVFILTFVVSHSYLACKCYETGTVKESFETSELVVYGKVIRRSYVSFKETMKAEKGDSLNTHLEGDKNNLLNSEAILKIEFEIKNIYKGQIISDTITIYTGRNSSSCGFTDFKEGGEYIIYGSSMSYLYGYFTNAANEKLEKSGTFWTSQCTRTTEYNEPEAKELEMLK
jgi:hypothetical protein